MGIPGAFVNFFAVPIIKKIGGNKKLLVYSEVITIIARLIAFRNNPSDESWISAE